MQKNTQWKQDEGVVLLCSIKSARELAFSKGQTPKSLRSVGLSVDQTHGACLPDWVKGHEQDANPQESQEKSRRCDAGLRA